MLFFVKIFLPLLEKIMSGILIIIVGMIYSYVAFEQWLNGNIPMFIVWAGYAFANLGLWMALR